MAMCGIGAGGLIMANFIKIENDIVTQSIVADTLEWCVDNLGGEWMENFPRYRAGIGMTFDRENDRFISPKPFPSWVLNESGDWEAPAKRPGEFYRWNETSLEWEAI
jgi:hypothetical protein